MYNRLLNLKEIWRKRYKNVKKNRALNRYRYISEYVCYYFITGVHIIHYLTSHCSCKDKFY